jgi:hypothetical protein
MYHFEIAFPGWTTAGTLLNECNLESPFKAGCQE